MLLRKAVAVAPDKLKRGDGEQVGMVYGDVTYHQADIFRAVAAMRGPDETLERLKSVWTTLGVVSALLMTFSFPAIFEPPYDITEDDGALVRAFQILNSLSSVGSIAVVIKATVFLAGTDWMCSPGHAAEYIVFISPLHEVLLITFCMSLLCLCIAVIIVTWLNTSRTIAIALTAIWGISTLAVILVFLVVFKTNLMLLKKHVNLGAAKRAATVVERLKAEVREAQSQDGTLGEPGDGAPRLRVAAEAALHKDVD